MAGDTFVLVHGSWHGSWCWDRLVPLLEQAGHRVVGVDLPGRDDPSAVARATLDDFVGAVVSSVEAVEDPVVLVGHSLAGITVTQAAEHIPHRLRRLVYVAAFLPTNGQSLLDLAAIPEFATSLALHHQSVDLDAGVSSIAPGHARETFYGRTEDPLAAAAAERLVPETLALTAAPVRLTPSGAGSVERSYVECLDDRAIPIGAQRVMHRAAGVEVVHTLDADHSPFLSRPVELAAVLNEPTRSRAAVAL